MKEFKVQEIEVDKDLMRAYQNWDDMCGGCAPAYDENDETPDLVILKPKEIKKQ